MTITINLCWYDKTCSFFERHGEFIKNTICKIIGFGCIPLFVIGWLRHFNVIFPQVQDYTFGYVFEQSLTGTFLIFGGIGSFVSLLYLSLYLSELNEKHQWIKFKHCESKEFES